MWLQNNRSFQEIIKMAFGGEETVMREVYVTSDVMATLFLTDRKMEIRPEPIRMQPSIQLVVGFSEYVDFCRVYLYQRDYLVTSTQEIKAYLDNEDMPALLRCFYKDMAVAVAKELFFAEGYRKGATQFRHTLGTQAIRISKREILETYDQYSIVAGAFLKQYMGSKGFPFPPSVSSENKFMYAYAMLLGWHGVVLPSRWEYV
jgi:hypothetical protein